jgi:hypothetical protein
MLHTVKIIVTHKYVHLYFNIYTICAVPVRACSSNGGKGNTYRILVGKPEGKRPLGRPRRRCVDSIKIDLREIGWDGVDWIGLAQDSCEHGNEPPGSIKCWEVLE